MDNIKGVLFDLDGVLLDTEGIYTEFWSCIDRAFPTGVERFAHVIKGSNLESILNMYFAREKHAEIVAMLNDFQRDMEYRFFPGALELLELLRDRAIPCALVTSSDSKKMDAVYGAHPTFRDYFAAVVTGEMVSEPKPSAECYKLGAKLLGVAIEDCLVVEDSLNGINAGVAGGARVAAIATTLPEATITAALGGDRRHRVYGSTSELLAEFNRAD